MFADGFDEISFSANSFIGAVATAAALPFLSSSKLGS